MNRVEEGVILDIITHPNSLLRERSLVVDNVGTEEIKLFDSMLKTMYFNHGIGLAAIQVGIQKRMIVVDIGNNNQIKLANPVIIAKKGNISFDEGCLSVPSKIVNITRNEEIVVKALDVTNKQGTFLFRGLSAVAVQHEIDHLDGHIILDYIK